MKFKNFILGEINLETKDNIFTKPIMVPILALLTCALWGSAFPAIKIGFKLFNVQSTGSKILFAGYRFFLSGILTLIIVSILNKKVVTIKAKSIPYITLQGILQTTIQYLFFYIGLSNTTGAKGSIINGSNAFFSLIAAHFLTKGEKITYKKAFGCIVGFLGIVLINLHGIKSIYDFNFLGDGLILLCSISFGVSSVTSKIFSKLENPNTITVYQLLSGGFILIIIGFILGGHIEAFTLKSSLLMLYLALLSAVSFTLWANLLKYNDVSKITIFGFTIPIFGVVMSSVILKENAFSLVTLISLFLVSIGIIIVNKSNN